MKARRKQLIIAFILVDLIIIGVFLARFLNYRSLAKSDAAEFRTALTKNGIGVVRRPEPFDGLRGPSVELPTYVPGKSDPFQIDLRGKDLRALDVKDRLQDLIQANFDDLTQWPTSLPAGFDPLRIREIGKNPGLRIRELHKKGITGRGVGIAIIDMGFLVGHAEYKDRLRLFEEIHSADETAQMHGVATASIAVGKTVGVAPEADLYYIASFPSKGGLNGVLLRDFTWEAKSIDRILEINRRLDASHKIRVISASIGWQPNEAGYEAVMKAVERAKKAGIFVICTSMIESYGFQIHGLGRDQNKDPDDIASFGDVNWGTYDSAGIHFLRFPIDSRTTAGPTGNEDYAFYRLGGLSWAVPWAAGLYALACQAKPDVTPQLFWEKALETGDSIVLAPKEPSLSEEEVEKRAKKMVDDGILRLKQQSQEKDIEVAYAKLYSQRSGEKKFRMNENEFRIWSLGWTRSLVLQNTKPRKLEKIVNPVKLISALVR